VRLGGEHAEPLVLAIGRDRKLVVLEMLRLHHRQLLDRVVGGRCGGALLCIEPRHSGGHDRRKQQAQVSA
jgi:hypothetical protein